MRNQCRCKIILRNELLSAKNGTAPLALRCLINGNRIVIAINLYVRPEDWDQINQRINSKNKTIESFNLAIDKAISKANEIFIDYHLRDIELTTELFKDEYLQTTNKRDFITFYKKELARRLKDDVISIGTHKGQKSTLTKLELYKPEIIFSELTPEFFQKFDAWHKKHLKASCKKKNVEQVKDSFNTRQKALSQIRTYVKLAISSGKARIKDPFDVIKIRQTQDNEVVFLESDEIKSLHQLYLSNELNTHLQATLAKFMFSLFTSIRISDGKRIEELRLHNNILSFEPTKTKRQGKTVNIPLNNTALQYFQYLKSIDFPSVSAENINWGLKKIAIKANINKRITFHVARHTFATQFIAMGNDVVVLKDIMGHNDIRTTMRYVHMAKGLKKTQILVMDNLLA